MSSPAGDSSRPSDPPQIQTHHHPAARESEGSEVISPSFHQQAFRFRERLGPESNRIKLFLTITVTGLLGYFSEEQSSKAFVNLSVGVLAF